MSTSHRSTLSNWLYFYDITALYPFRTISRAQHIPKSKIWLVPRFEVLMVENLQHKSKICARYSEKTGHPCYILKVESCLEIETTGWKNWNFWILLGHKSNNSSRIWWNNESFILVAIANGCRENLFPWITKGPPPPSGTASLKKHFRIFRR